MVFRARGKLWLLSYGHQPPRQRLGLDGVGIGCYAAESDGIELSKPVSIAVGNFTLASEARPVKAGGRQPGSLKLKFSVNLPQPARVHDSQLTMYKPPISEGSRPFLRQFKGRQIERF